jgi:predicted DNA-binding protein
MNAKKVERKKVKDQNSAAVRASISFPPDVYETLETIAKQKKVSLAWVVREATEQYLAEKWPLFAKGEPKT